MRRWDPSHLSNPSHLLDPSHLSNPSCLLGRSRLSDLSYLLDPSHLLDLTRQLDLSSKPQDHLRGLLRRYLQHYQGVLYDLSVQSTPHHSHHFRQDFQLGQSPPREDLSHLFHLADLSQRRHCLWRQSGLSDLRLSKERHRHLLGP